MARYIIAVANSKVVMPRLDRGIHLHVAAAKKLDGRVKPGHDERTETKAPF